MFGSNSIGSPPAIAISTLGPKSLPNPREDMIYTDDQHNKQPRCKKDSYFLLLIAYMAAPAQPSIRLARPPVFFSVAASDPLSLDLNMGFGSCSGAGVPQTEFALKNTSTNWNHIDKN